MEFKRFSSLENSYRQNLINKVQYEGKDTGQWIVTEKIHGANFSFWCDGTEVRVASRTQFVDGTFFNCQAVINQYSDNIMSLFHGANQGSVLVVYGELFGGNIQKEVEYGEKDFKAFDVVWDGKPINKLEAEEDCEAHGISFVPIILVGSFAQCLNVGNTFRSTLTPEGYDEENISEGLVIEPIEPNYLNNGTRIYFKNKTESFSEKKRQPKQKQVFELSEEESDLMNEILEYNTASRVLNVLSKVGEITNKDFGKVLGLTTQDLLEDFVKDTEKDPKKIAENNWKQFLKLLQVEVGKTVREEFLKKLDT